MDDFKGWEGRVGNGEWDMADEEDGEGPVGNGQWRGEKRKEATLAGGPSRTKPKVHASKRRHAIRKSCCLS